MMKDRKTVAENLLNLTLEILYQLTGEDYTLAKKNSYSSPVSKGRRRTPSPILGLPTDYLIHDEINVEKILELTMKMAELLTGEVPIRCQDVAVYFSMEEWEYVEGHKDLYQDVMMEDPRPLTSPVTSRERRSPERCPRPLLPQDDQLLYEKKDLNQIDAVETYVGDQEECKEDFPIDNHLDDCNGSLEEHLISSYFNAEGYGMTQDTFEEHDIIPVIPSVLLSPDPSSDPFLHAVSSYSQTNQSVRRGVEHHRAPTGERPLSCLECGKCFTQKSHLVTHQRIHTGEKPFSCSVCGKCFTDKSNLVRHQRIHTGSKPFSCPQCAKCFNQKSHLIQHLRTHTGDKPYSCTECGKFFIHKSDFFDHCKAHMGGKPYLRPDCGNRFSQRTNLVNHQRIHREEQSYSCLECGQCFTKEEHLLEHLRIHTEVKPYVCLECKKCFTCKGSLIEHLKLHTPEPFLCTTCGKCFSQKWSLISHQRTHTGLTYSCPECGKCFSRKSNLLKHHRSHARQ